jgi:hypothetical protein
MSVAEAINKKFKGNARDVQRELNDIFGPKAAADLYKLIAETDRLAKSRKEAFSATDPLNADLALTGYSASVKRLGIIFDRIKDTILAGALDQFGLAVAKLVDSGDLEKLISTAEKLGKVLAFAGEGWLKIFGYFEDISKIYENQQKFKEIDETNKFNDQRRKGVASMNSTASDALGVTMPPVSNNEALYPRFQRNPAEMFGTGGTTNKFYFIQPEGTIKEAKPARSMQTVGMN